MELRLLSQGQLWEEQIWGLDTENQQFIFEHTNFKMPIGYPVEMLNRQLDIRVYRSRERSR